MSKKIKILSIFLFLTHVLLSQQDPAFNYYMFNHQSVNPAYVGSKNYTTITSVYRSQWSGFEGSPITQTASFNKPIRSKNIGVGLGVIGAGVGLINGFGFIGKLHRLVLSLVQVLLL